MIIAASMLLSRVLGIFREMLLAKTAGINAEKNALDLSFMIPDILNHVVSTGFLSIIFIPIFTGYLVKGEEERGYRFFSNVLNVLGVFLLILIVPSFVWMKELLQFFTAAELPEELLLRATHFGRLILPAQLFIFAGSFLVSLQHTRKQFLIPSLTGVIYNLSIILGGLLLSDRGLEGFALGVPVGAFVGFFLLQIYGARRGGIRYIPVFSLRDKDIARYLKMMLPMSLGVGSMFALEFVIRSFGGNFGSEGISSLNYAYRVMYTLVAVFGFSVGVASYPDMARLVKEEKYPELNQKIWRSLSRMFCILVSAVVSVWALSFPAVRILFERGAFSRETSEAVSMILRWYLPVSFGLCLQAILVRSFYAAERMWLPTILNTGIFALTLPAYLLLGKTFGIYSVPIVGAIGAILQVVSMIVLWAHKNGCEGMREALFNMLRALVSFGVVICLAIFHDRVMGDFLREWDILFLAIYSALFGVFLFILTLWIEKLLRSSDAKDLWEELYQKFRRKLPI